jgi:hypothetical protein
MDSETTVERYSRYLQEMNTGVMASLQADPNDTSGPCNTITGETNVLIEEMFKSDNYSTGEINQTEFGEKFQIMTFSLMDQLDNCKGSEILIVLDSAMNNVSGLASSFSSLATQIGLGWEN